ncbi:probable ATP-dependent RNA helicase DDX52 [Protopterus annectens]|uniref:probable ATP-dependent RNA helicase DDX52 n=1 Tax=Protopterus annectens TaxID=7888 RepID=UPI001CF9CBB4|nr:probable ATP-dependent RNA helicase DDX52 [Protopterus annectens]
MDAFDLFCRLGAGARFDLKRFGEDAERFKVGKSKDIDFSKTSKSAKGLDFFGTKQNDTKEENKCGTRKSKTEIKTVIPSSDELGEMNKAPVSLEKRKRVESSKKKKRRKKEGSDVDTLDSLVNDDDAIQWMSSQQSNLKHVGESGNEKLTAEKLEQLRQEKINHFRNQHKIYVQGSDIPEPVATFQQLQEEYKVHPKIMENIKEAGFQLPTPVQMQAIPIMLHNREVLACAPTGSGKTLSFSVPILVHLKQPMNKGFRALILAPTRELASQTHRELEKLSEGTGFRTHMIHKTAMAAKKFGPKSSNKFDILVTTPNRLIYLLKQDPPAVNLSNVEWLVVDESDKLFEDGKTGFRDQLATIFLACTSHTIRRAMFSATFAHDVEQWCKLNLDNVISVSIGARNSAVETVEQELLFVGNEAGKLLAVRDLVKKGFSPPVLVFVQSVDRAKELFRELVYEGVNVEVIHAERTQQQRDNIVQSFRAGKIWVLICTSLLARGVDFKGVNLVLNYDFPNSAVEYIHRIGRTGRAGHSGKAITFFTEDDKPLLRSIANVIKQAGCPVPDYMMTLHRLQSKQKKRMMKRPVKREHILTTPHHFLKKGSKKKAGQKRERENKTKLENIGTTDDE